MIKFPCEVVNVEKFLASAKSYQPEFLLKLYFVMLRIRMVEEAIERDYHKDKMKSPVHLCIGQEASAAGCNLALQTDDLIYCSHRTHGHYLAKGGDLPAMMAELHCRETGCAKSLAGSMHLLDKKVGMEGSSAIVAGAIPIATGFALSQKLNKASTISVVFFGDAATEEGVHWESLNFAILKKLPIIFVCENNFYSVCTPLDERQPSHVKIIDRVAQFGSLAQEVNGNDILAVYALMSRAVSSVREGKGPYYLVVNSYRWRGHHGAGDDSKTGYRHIEELESWMAQDPIKILKQALRQQEILTLQMDEAYKNKIQMEIEESFEFALNSPYPSQELLFNTVYAS
jgi:TPP-dependent pyruvate/acetoin dehydrogenase alpha subunit